jgi:hypothetical protein
MLARLFYLLFVLVILFGIADAGNCTQQAPMRLKTSVVWFDISGSQVVATAVRNGSPVGNNKIFWDLAVMVEREKTPTIPSGNTVIDYNCIMPRLDLSEFFNITAGGTQLNPLEPAVPGQVCTGESEENAPGENRCGTVVSHIGPDDLDCYSERIEDKLGGFNRTSIITHHSHPLYPNFQFVSSYELLDGDYNYTYNHPAGGTFQIVYRCVNHRSLVPIPTFILPF